MKIHVSFRHKKKRIGAKRLLVACLILVQAESMKSQEEGTLDLYLGGGISFPSEPIDFSNYWKTGFNVAVGVGYPLPPSLTVVGQVEFSRFAPKRYKFQNDFGLAVSGGAVMILSASANMKAFLFKVPDGISPYFLVGVGYSRFTTSDVSLALGGTSGTFQGDSESALFVHLGVGIDYQIDEQLYIFIQSKYGIGFTRDESVHYVPAITGVKLKL